MGAPLRKYKLIREAIEKAKSRDVGKVSLALEILLHDEMSKWPSYIKLTKNGQYDAICRRLETYGIFTSNDIRNLIDEVAMGHTKGNLRQVLGL
jgi:hypothetical protein